MLRIGLFCVVANGEVAVDVCMTKTTKKPLEPMGADGPFVWRHRTLPIRLKAWTSLHPQKPAVIIKRQEALSDKLPGYST